MSQSVRGFEKSIVAGEDLTAAQFSIVQLSATGEIEAGEGATDLLVGVLQNTPGAGEMATYRFIGTAKVKLGGTVGIGAWVTSDASGHGVATTTANDAVIGRALEAGVDGDIIEVQLMIGTLATA